MKFLDNLESFWNVWKVRQGTSSQYQYCHLILRRVPQLLLEGVQENYWPNKARLALSCTGCFFNCSALKITKCQPAREISDLFLPKKGLRMKKIKVPELFRTVHLHKMTKEKLQVTQLLLPLAACLKIANLRIESNLLLLSREVVYSADY